MKPAWDSDDRSPETLARANVDVLREVEPLFVEVLFDLLQACARGEKQWGDRRQRAAMAWLFVDAMSSICLAYRRTLELEYGGTKATYFNESDASRVRLLLIDPVDVMEAYSLEGWLDILAPDLAREITPVRRDLFSRKDALALPDYFWDACCSPSLVFEPYWQAWSRWWFQQA